jgi:hypothetical protein
MEALAMKIGKVVTAAGFTFAICAFAPSAFAQAGAGGAAGAPGGMPATSAGGQSATNQAPSAGQPGTQAPASAAPVGAASSDYMANEGRNGARNSSISGPGASNSETRARWLETKVERDIVAARANGMNVAKAEHHKWLGSVALSKGDRSGAMRHFDLAENDLNSTGFRTGRGNQQYSNSRTNLNAHETNQSTNAANMHSNRGANSAY